MSLEGEPQDSDTEKQNRSLSPEQLRGLQYGVAATLMPVREGWRVHYFSIPDFDSEPGTTFTSFDEAIAAIGDVLPAVNSEDERARAREELDKQTHRSRDFSG